MTFASIETSADEGRPLELLMISFLTNHWYYTTQETNVVHDGNAYTPLPFSHSSIPAGADVGKASITIKVPQDCPVGELFRVQSPPGVVTVTIFAKHSDDAEVKAIWKGRITNSDWNQPWLSLTSESIVSSLQRVGLRRKFSMQCPHALYGIGHGLCNVVKDDHKHIYTVTSITGATINCVAANDKPANYFAGGYLTWIHATSGYLEQRMIKSSDVTGNLVVTSAPPGLAIGDSLTAYAGCDHEAATCDTKFGNSLNYGGWKYIPLKNPFNGSTLY